MHFRTSSKSDSDSERERESLALIFSFSALSHVYCVVSVLNVCICLTALNNVRDIKAFLAKTGDNRRRQWGLQN
jgi:hypothetical protein